MESTPRRHDVILNDRSRMRLTGIDDVCSFDENGIVLRTGEDGMTIEGEHLHIEHFDAEKTELSLTGNVTGFFYFGKAPKKGKRTLFGRKDE